jgi:ribonuclease HI
MAKKKYYAVVNGRTPGIYIQWIGTNGAESQVNGFPGSIYKGFPTLAEAEEWYKQASAAHGYPTTKATASGSNPDVEVARHSGAQAAELGHEAALAEGKVVIYTDGACIGNPGPGGYGVVILSGRKRVELSGGYKPTTNNRMEIMACIAALDTLEQPSQVVLYSDSQYVVKGISENWARNWRARNWRKSGGGRAENSDLWSKLLDLCDRHRVQFEWIRGHVGTEENERCDILSMQAASQRDLPSDPGYSL